MIQIIKAEEKHIPDICRLWLEFINFHAEIEPIFAPKDDAVTGFEKEFLRPKMNSDKSRVQLALDGEKVVGYAVSEILDLHGAKFTQCGVVDHLHITKDYRRQGIGEKLYQEALKWFHDNGIKVVQVQLTARNNLACSFWRKQGFRDFQHNWYLEI